MAAAAGSRPGPRLQRIGLVPFVAVLYAYCAGGPFGFESMASASGPGMSLLLILAVPWLFSVPISLATAEMASALPVEGGFYRWTRLAFGDFAGFLCGWWNWTGTFLMCGAYGVMLADYIGNVAPMSNRLEHWLIAFAFLLFVGWLNVRGIRLVGHLTLALLMAALVPVGWFTVRGFSMARANPFQPFMAPGQRFNEVFGVGLALALWIYSGYEQLSTVAEEIQQPERNFPRALALTVPLAIITFLLPVAAGLAALGNWQEWQTGYMVTAARLIGGRGLQWSIFAAAAVCTFVLLESTVLSATRLPFAMAEDGYFHPELARLHPRYRTPVTAIVLSVALCSVLALFSLTRLISVYAWLRVASSVMTLLSLWRLRQVAPELPRRFRVPGGRSGLAAVVLVPIALFLWALINSDPESRWLGLLALATGPVAYVTSRRRPAASSAILEKT
jgi:amino acid transporter